MSDRNMMDKVEKITQEEVKVEKTPTLESSPNNLVVNVSGEVDMKMQPLRDVRPVIHAPKVIPGDLDQAGTMVMALLFKVFERQQYIKEGLIGDLLFGFDQCGVPSDMSIMGLKDLNKKGYIKFQAKDNTYVSIDSDKAGSAWIKYMPKLKSLIS